jgi:hypothetical protein
MRRLSGKLCDTSPNCELDGFTARQSLPGLSSDYVEPIVDAVVELQKHHLSVNDFRCQRRVGLERVRKVNGHGPSFNEDEVGIKAKRTLLE